MSIGTPWLLHWPRRHPGPALILGLALLLLAYGCGSSGSVGQENAYWNAPTPSPIPTVCRASDPPPTPPGCDTCTPAPPLVTCTTPMPTMTPYFRWQSPGDEGNQSTFYAQQDVRIGALRLTLTSYTTRPINDGTGDDVHIFQFDTQNESASEVFDIQWPLQTFIREIHTRGANPADDQTITGLWRETDRGDAAAGVPRWTPDRGTYQPQQRRQITVAIAAPAGRAQAIGFQHTLGPLPGAAGSTTPTDLPPESLISWFLPLTDPHAPGQNASGPGRQDETAAYPKAINTPGPVRYNYFAGWPVPPNGGWEISQDFGCTAYPELSCRTYPAACQCYSVDPGKPYFHLGTDITGPPGTRVLSILYGVVTYVGPSSGRYCDFGDPPHENLGFVVEIQSQDPATGRAGPYHVKFGHLVVNSAQVAIGDHVQPGTVLGTMGNTGCSSGRHTHVQIQTPDGTAWPLLVFIHTP